MEITENSHIPKYKQLVRLVISDIQSGIYRIGDRIPSINEASMDYILARETVEKAYKELSEQGIIEPVKGKGYFVSTRTISTQPRICLLFNKLSNYKQETYMGFMETMQDKAMVDLFVYNFNIHVFERIILENLDRYNYFVIIPHFHPGSVGLENIIHKIPKEKVFIIDKKINPLSQEYPGVFQDFENDIFSALEQGLTHLRDYSQLVLAFPTQRFFSGEIRSGFIHFCRTYQFQYRVIDRIEDEKIQTDEAWVVISDDDLIQLIEKIHKKNYTLGKDIGVISYNEAPVKEILEGGITTISTNHKTIGMKTAEMILTGKKATIRIPYLLHLRKSL
jgi:DNA-binding transcriptional regulator YhcF (GntR family)